MTDELQEIWNMVNSMPDLDIEKLNREYWNLMSKREEAIHKGLDISEINNTIRTKVKEFDKSVEMLERMKGEK